MREFFRLVVPERNRGSGQLSGVFVAAYRLRDAEALPTYEHVVLADQIDWFEDNLRAPRPMIDAAICWFKGAANPCTRRIWELA